MRSYLFIASEVRSGSTFVAESIAYYLDRRSGLQFWDLANEHLADATAETSGQELLQIAQNLYLDSSGFASTKIMCKALSVLNKAAATSQEIKQTFFGDRAYWIVVRRRDKLRQAISLATAEKSGVYHFYGDPSGASDEAVTVSPVEVEKALKAIVLSDLYLDVFSRSLPENRVISLFYEDFVQDNGKYLNLVNELCGFPTDSDVSSCTNLAKLTRTGQKGKHQTYDEFCSWFLNNYD